MQTLENRFIAILAIIYTVGIIGFSIPSLNPLFLKLTPYNLIISFLLALVFSKKWSFPEISILLIIGILGFFVELAGVQTKLIFGDYSYGQTFGAKWLDVPYLIGLNWAAMIYYSSNILVGRVKNPWIAAGIGALLMTIYDFFLEPVAMKYDFWDWKSHSVPFQNYIAWFVIALIFHRLYNYMAKPTKNKIASSLYVIQLLFFVGLYILIQLGF